MMLQQLSALAALVICSYEDLKNKQICMRWLYVFASEGVFLWIAEGKYSMFEIISAIGPGLLMLILAFSTKGSIGQGDGFLIMIIGMFVGGATVWKVLLSALFLSGSYAVFLFAIRKKNRKYEIAFIPFLLLAFIGESFIQFIRGWM